MITRCGALVLGLMVMSATSALAQVTVGFPVNTGAYTGVSGYSVNYTPNNVATYQNQLMQTQQAYSGAYGAYGAYNGAAYNGSYTAGYNNNAYTIMGYGSPNGVNPAYTSYGNGAAYVGVNPWNGYAGNSYNGYNYSAYTQPAYTQSYSVGVVFQGGGGGHCGRGGFLRPWRR